MDDRKISIIVPIYNCEKYIPRLLKTVYNQSYKHYELIIINDGSTDNSLTIIEKLKKNNTIIIDKKNTGVSDSRNIGLEIATGDFITFLDADDYIDEYYFETIMEYFHINPDIDLLGFGYYSEVENEKLERISRNVFEYKEIFYRTKADLSVDLVDLWDNKMLYNIWNKVYRREKIIKNNLKFYDLNWGEDMEFNKQYINFSKNIYISNKVFYHYIRERKGAATNIYRKDFFEIRKQEYKEFNLYFNENNIVYEQYIEFSSRRFIECVLGVIENIFCSNLNFKEKYNKIKEIIFDEDVMYTVNVAKPKTIKTKLMLLPIKWKNTLFVMIMGKTINIIKLYMPAIFNYLKNTR